MRNAIGIVVLALLTGCTATGWSAAREPAPDDPPDLLFAVDGEAPGPREEPSVTSLSFSVDGRTLIATTGEKRATAWSLERREPVFVLTTRDEIPLAEFVPGGKYLATRHAATSDSLRVWSADDA